jgi:hypothetical protein
MLWSIATRSGVGRDWRDSAGWGWAVWGAGTCGWRLACTPERRKRYRPRFRRLRGCGDTGGCCSRSVVSGGWGTYLVGFPAVGCSPISLLPTLSSSHSFSPTPSFPYPLHREARLRCLQTDHSIGSYIRMGLGWTSGSVGVVARLVRWLGFCGNSHLEQVRVEASQLELLVKCGCAVTARLVGRNVDSSALNEKYQ